MLVKKLKEFRDRFTKQIKKDIIFSVFVLFIIALLLLFRLFNYTDRAYILSDNSRDVQVARYALDNNLLPQIGQFSSAGPFHYGPWFYWYLMTVNVIPLGFLTSWYVLSFIYLLFAYLIYMLGTLIWNKWLGALAALYSSVSPALTNTSFAVWNPSYVPILILLTLIFFVYFYKTGKYFYLFLLAFTTSLAVPIHLQSAMAIPILLVALFLPKINLEIFLRRLSTIALGVFVPLLPLLYFDSQHNWHNSKSLLIFVTVDQFNQYVPNRWLSYVFNYWPESWAYIIGGTKWVALLIMISLAVIFVVKLKSAKGNKIFFIISLIFLLDLALYRYYRGPRFRYYSMFAYPFILILSALATLYIFSWKKTVGVIFISTILFFSILNTYPDLYDRSISYSVIKNLSREIYSHFPGDKFDIYGCWENSGPLGQPLALAVYIDKKSDLNGVKIGVCEVGNAFVWQHINNDGDVQTKQKLWIRKNTPIAYVDSVDWWREKPPQKGEGNMIKFIWENFGSR